MDDGVDGQEGTEWFSASSSVPVPGAAVDVPVVAVASTTPVAQACGCLRCQRLKMERFVTSPRVPPGVF